MKREKIDDIYSLEESVQQWVPSGCTLLDCMLGNGYPLGRIVNIVGDRSTAKTALATEAVINFLQKYPNGAARYAETEAAFDTSYAKSMGLPLDKVDFGNPDEHMLTVEDFSRDLAKYLEERTKTDTPGIYVLDSLDALSDESELSKDISEGSFGAAKAKKLSQLFRMYTRKVSDANVLLLVVSQVRDNIGAMFGEKHKRSGGKALDFYASIVIYLAHIKTLKKTISKVERPYGVMIKAKTKKNKVAPAFREVEFPFLFNYGVDDEVASKAWLKTVGCEEEYTPELVKRKWAEIETKFLPPRKKYDVA
jgi:recombination protein RecA